MIIKEQDVPVYGIEEKSTKALKSYSIVSKASILDAKRNDSRHRQQVSKNRVVSDLGTVCRKLFELAYQTTKVIYIEEIIKGVTNTSPNDEPNKVTETLDTSAPTFVKLSEITDTMTNIICVESDEKEKYAFDALVPNILPSMKTFYKIENGLTVVHRTNLDEEERSI